MLTVVRFDWFDSRGFTVKLIYNVSRPPLFFFFFFFFIVSGIGRETDRVQIQPCSPFFRLQILKFQTLSCHYLIDKQNNNNNNKTCKSSDTTDLVCKLFQKKLFCYCCCFLFLGCLLLYCTYTHSYLHTYSQVLTFHWVDLTWDLERLSVSTLTAFGHVIPTANRLAAIAKFCKWVPKPCPNQSELTWSASIQLCR